MGQLISSVADLDSSDDDSSYGGGNGWESEAEAESCRMIRTAHDPESEAKHFPNGNVLHRHIRRGRWVAASTVARTQPILASGLDGDGRTPLHVACRNYMTDPPLSLVVTLLRASVSAAAVTDDDGNTPLHYAADAAVSDSIFAAVLTAHPPSALIPNLRGELPLHLADRTAAILALASRYPHTISTPENGGHTPLFLFTDLLLRHLPPDPNIRTSLSPSIVFRKQCPPFTAISLPDCWSTVASVVRMTGHGTLPTLHASVLYPAVPLRYVRQVAYMYPDQVRVRDAWGNLPLHLACRIMDDPRGGSGGGGTIREGGGSRGGGGGGGQTDDGETPAPAPTPPPPRRGWSVRVSYQSMYDARFLTVRRGRRRYTDAVEGIVSALVELHPPGAAERDGAGRLPLEICGRSGMTWGAGLVPLLRANPTAVHEVGMDDALLPRVLAKVGRRVASSEGGGEGTTSSSSCSGGCGLSTLYEVVRGRPDVLKDARPPRRSRRKRRRVVDEFYRGGSGAAADSAAASAVAAALDPPPPPTAGRELLPLPISRRRR